MPNITSDEAPAPTTAIAPGGRVAAELVRLHFDEAERQILRNSFLSGANDAEALALIKTAERMNLDPFKRQIHFVKRRGQDDEGNWVEKWAFQTSIDGFRGRAEETGEYDGTDEAVFSFEARINPITGEALATRELVARVTVHRKGRRPCTGVARWSEFVQKKRGGDPVRMWATMPYHMLAKCAEALALRQAFPERLGGLYTDDEAGSVADEGPTADGGAERPEVAKAKDDLRKQAEKRAARKRPEADPAPAASAPPGVDPATADAAQLDKLLDESDRDGFTRSWAAIKARADYAEIGTKIRASFERNRARLWPQTAKPAPSSEPPARPAPPARSAKDEKWLGEITRAGGGEGEDVWEALNDAYDAQIPGELLRAFEARWPSAPVSVDERTGETV